MESDIVEQLREEGFVTHMARLPRESKILHAAADEIERLRRERDEARRSYCYATANGDEQKALNVARGRGWDCFKENT